MTISILSLSLSKYLNSKPSQLDFLNGPELGPAVPVCRENHKFQLCNIRQDMAVNGEIYIILCIHIRKVPCGLRLKTTLHKRENNTRCRAWFLKWLFCIYLFISDIWHSNIIISIRLVWLGLGGVTVVVRPDSLHSP